MEQRLKPGPGASRSPSTSWGCQLGMAFSPRARWTRPILSKGWKAAHKPGSVHRRRARGPGGGGDHLSGTAVTGGLERHWGNGTGTMANPCSAGRSPGLAPGRGLPSRHLSMPLVRSYRTLAPLPVRPADRGPQVAIGGVFLWHCPHGRPHRALPGRPGHRGARTFLNRPEHHRGRNLGNAPPIAITSATFQG